MAAKEPDWGGGDTLDGGDGVEDTINTPSSEPSELGHELLTDSTEEFEMVPSPVNSENGNAEGCPPMEDAGAGEEVVETVSDPVSAPEEEWLDVLGNGLLKKKVLEAGNGPDSRAQKGQNVRIHLKISLADCTAVGEEPSLFFTLGDGDVIQALDLTVQLMELNEKAVIQTSAARLWSSAPVVAADADLTLEVQLLEVADAPIWSSCPHGENGAGGRKRERGNEWYQRGDFGFALNSYNIALQATEASSSVELSPAEEEELLEMKVKCLNNMAAAQLKLDRHEAALRSCVAVLAHQPDNVKALFRKGKVLALQGEYSEAIGALKRAQKLEPGNKTIHAELSVLVKKRSEQRGLEQAMCKKMLGNPSSAALEKHQPKSSWGLPWKWLFGATAVAIGGVALSVVIAARN